MQRDPNPGEQDRLQLSVPRAQAGKRLDEALAALIPSRTRAYHQKLVRRGRVSVNGRRQVRSNLRVNGGDLLVIVGLDARREPRPAQGLRFLHIDDTIAVVDKPAGVVTHRNEKICGGTLADLAAAELGRLPVILGDERPGIVHRLDRETSGVLVLGRTEEAMLHLQAQFRERSVTKTYLAFAHGVAAESQFVCEGALSPEAGGVDRQRVSRSRHAKAARTQFRVLDRFKAVTLFECVPQTGRRHQIRVHLAHAGHPILDDRLYEPAALHDRPEGCPRPARHALHAAALELTHPASGEKLRFEAPLPPELERLRTWLE